jgi:lipoate---protein ligase
MNLLISPDSDPYTNLAIEECLLKNSLEDFIFLYVNRPCVVVGKHQITTKEINSIYISEHNILVARRLSGGGTVFHDEGNLNFSIIKTNTTGVNISYKQLSQPIIEFLRREGAEVYLSERNDILLKDKKVSGSAMHIYKNRAIAHGTLLIDCNLKNLSSSLNSHPERFTDKSIASVPSKVMNLSELHTNFTVSYIINQFTKFMHNQHSEVSLYSIPAHYKIFVQQLVDEKYSNNDWIYGYSPKYNYKNSFDFNGSRISYYLQIEKGIINKALIESPNEVNGSIELEFNGLIGTPHNISILKKLESLPSTTDFKMHLISSLF